MAKRIRPAMLRFAKEIGAWKGNRPDWYLVAEQLAEIAVPELLSEEPSGRGPGRPPAPERGIHDRDDFFAAEVHRVQWSFGCGVKEACCIIAKGSKKVPLPTRSGQPKRSITSGPWKGQS